MKIAGFLLLFLFIPQLIKIYVEAGENVEDVILSVGIDIGTSTTSMVVSRLSVKNTASCFTVPHVAITDKEIIYRSRIYQTPQEEGNRIDIRGISSILDTEYKKAGISPEEVQTGAVIITGESSRKENARLVTEAMSSQAGEFVVASAGPDLESVIAGKGSGAQRYSEEKARTVANFDVGGGTTNIAVFKNGELAARGCLDIGGRLIRVKDGKIAYISERLRHIIEETGEDIRLGERADPGRLHRITDRMAGILGESIGALPETPLCRESKTRESGELEHVKGITDISFSGGVADYIYRPDDHWFLYNDIGLLLADSIRNSSWVKSGHVIQSEETIQATVIGAGSYTTSVSGSTISFSDEAVFPMKNVPVFTVPGEEEKRLLAGEWEAYAKEAEWFLRESSADNIVFSLGHTERPSYREVTALADSLLKVSSSVLNRQPLLIVCRNDFAKALGMAVRRKEKSGRPVVCLDSIYVTSGDYVDFGKPLMNGLAVPVVVKTLIFGE